MKKHPLTLFCFLTGMAIICATAAEDGEMTALDARRRQERAAGARAALAQYADRLATLRTRLLAKGDTDGAARAQLELDRVLPAVSGAPDHTEKEAGDLGIFEDAPPDAETAVPSGMNEAELEKLIASLTADSGPAAAGSGPVASPAAAPATGTRIPLRMTAAGYLPALPATNTPKGHLIWTTGRSASWTVRDLVPGHYRLLLRYGAAEEEGGGTLLVRLGREKLTASIATTGGWSRRAELLTEPLVVTTASADLTLSRAPDTDGGEWLFDLQSVTLVPSAGPEPKGAEPAK